MTETREVLWGEFDENNDDPWGDHSFVLSDYEELLTPQSYPPSSTALHQPSQQLTSSFQILSGESTRSDVTVQNTIRLLQYTRHVSHLINRAQSLISGGSSSGNGTGDMMPSSPLPACPPLPAEIPLPRTPISFQTLNFLPPQSTSFTAAQDSGLNLEVEHGTARKILRQSVALVLAHAGFTETTESVLRTLTDIVHDFMTKLTKAYKVNVDNAALMSNYCPFHDVLEQTLKELNMGGLLDLHTMYRDRVQAYHASVKANAVHLANYYAAMVTKQQQQQQQQLQQIPWQSTNTTATTTCNGSAALSGGSTYSTVFPTAGGGTINITIGNLMKNTLKNTAGAVPGSAGLNYPNLSASTGLEDGSVEASGGGGGRITTSSGGGNGSRSTRVVVAASGIGGSSVSRSSSSGGDSGTAAGSNIINLEHELSRHYAPVTLQSSDSESQNQNSPLATHFTINPR